MVNEPLDYYDERLNETLDYRFPSTNEELMDEENRLFFQQWCDTLDLFEVQFVERQEYESQGGKVQWQTPSEKGEKRILILPKDLHVNEMHAVMQLVNNQFANDPEQANAELEAEWTQYRQRMIALIERPVREELFRYGKDRILEEQSSEIGWGIPESVVEEYEKRAWTLLRQRLVQDAREAMGIDPPEGEKRPTDPVGEDGSEGESLDDAWLNGLLERHPELRGHMEAQAALRGVDLNDQSAMERLMLAVAGDLTQYRSEYPQLHAFMNAPSRTLHPAMERAYKRWRETLEKPEDDDDTNRTKSFDDETRTIFDKRKKAGDQLLKEVRSGPLRMMIKTVHDRAVEVLGNAIQAPEESPGLMDNLDRAPGDLLRMMGVSEPEKKTLRKKLNLRAKKERLAPLRTQREKLRYSAEESALHDLNRLIARQEREALREIQTEIQGLLRKGVSEEHVPFSEAKEKGRIHCVIHTLLATQFAHELGITALPIASQKHVFVLGVTADQKIHLLDVGTKDQSFREIDADDFQEDDALEQLLAFAEQPSQSGLRLTMKPDRYPGKISERDPRPIIELTDPAYALDEIVLHNMILKLLETNQYGAARAAARQMMSYPSPRPSAHLYYTAILEAELDIKDDRDQIVKTLIENLQYRDQRHFEALDGKQPTPNISEELKREIEAKGLDKLIAALTEDDFFVRSSRAQDQKCREAAPGLGLSVDKLNDYVHVKINGERWRETFGHIAGTLGQLNRMKGDFIENPEAGASRLKQNYEFNKFETDHGPWIKQSVEVALRYMRRLLETETKTREIEERETWLRNEIVRWEALGEEFIEFFSDFPKTDEGQKSTETLQQELEDWRQAKGDQLNHYIEILEFAKTEWRPPDFMFGTLEEGSRAFLPGELPYNDRPEWEAYPEIEHHLRKSLTLDPGNAVAWHRLGQLWMEQGDRAQQETGKHVMFPEDVSGHAAQCYRKAIPFLRRSYKLTHSSGLNETNAAKLKHLAQAHARGGQCKEAAQVYAYLLTHDPENDEYAKNLFLNLLYLDRENPENQARAKWAFLRAPEKCLELAKTFIFLRDMEACWEATYKERFRLRKARFIEKLRDGGLSQEAIERYETMSEEELKRSHKYQWDSTVLPYEQEILLGRITAIDESERTKALVARMGEWIGENTTSIKEDYDNWVAYRESKREGFDQIEE